MTKFYLAPVKEKILFKLLKKKLFMTLPEVRQTLSQGGHPRDCRYHCDGVLQWGQGWTPLHVQHSQVRICSQGAGWSFLHGKLLKRNIRAKGDSG